MHYPDIFLAISRLDNEKDQTTDSCALWFCNPLKPLTAILPYRDWAFFPLQKAPKEFFQSRILRWWKERWHMRSESLIVWMDLPCRGKQQKGRPGETWRTGTLELWGVGGRRQIDWEAVGRLWTLQEWWPAKELLLPQLTTFKKAFVILQTRGLKILQLGVKIDFQWIKDGSFVTSRRMSIFPRWWLCDGSRSS